MWDMLGGLSRHVGRRGRGAPLRRTIAARPHLDNHTTADPAMDLKLAITIIDELSDDEVRAEGQLDLASGEIRDVRYVDYDAETQGIPPARQDYEFSVGVLRAGNREVEFRVDVDVVGARYSVTPTELLELKGRAAKLFSQAPDSVAAAAPAKKAARKSAGRAR